MAVGAAAPDDIYSNFAKQRQLAQQQGNAAKQQNNEAIKRRFASIGNLNSGAAIKAAGQQDQASDAGTEAALNQIDSAEQAQRFQSGEAQKTRDLQASQFDKSYGLQEKQFAEDQKANSLNAIQALGTLSDETLRQLGGASTDWGGTGNAKNIAAILGRYGYSR